MVVVGIPPFSNTAGKQLFALNGISILSWNKQLLALGHAQLQQSASVEKDRLVAQGPKSFWAF